MPAQRDCVAFRWEGDPINEASDAPWKYASHWSTPPWNHRPVECLYTAAQLREYATQAVRQAANAIFAEGWYLACDWLERDDLKFDVDSPAFAADRAARLAALLTLLENNSER